jgi:hypothetical protein
MSTRRTARTSRWKRDHGLCFCGCVLVVYTALTCTWRVLAEEVRIVQQSSEGSANIVGNNNTTLQNVVINVWMVGEKEVDATPALVARTLFRVSEHSPATENPRLARQIADLQRSEREVGELVQKALGRRVVTQPTGAQLPEELSAIEAKLKQQNEEILTENPDLAHKAKEHLRDAVAVRSNIDAMPESSQKQSAIEAWRKADLDEATREILAYETHGFGIGAAAMTVFDSRSGLAGGGGEVYLSLPAIPLTVGTVASILEYASFGEFFGSYRSAIVVAPDLRAGLRVRFGAPNGLLIGIYYDCPIVVVETKTSSFRELSRATMRFPLVGMGADLGLVHGILNVRATYRYAVETVLYPHGENKHFLGLAVGLGL